MSDDASVETDELLSKISELTRELIEQQEKLFYYKSGFNTLMKEHEQCQ